MQDPPAHCVSPLIHDKLIKESLHSDGGEKYVNEHTAQDDKQSATKQLVKQNSFSSVLPSKHQTSSTSQYPEAPDARPRTSATDIPSTSASPPLPVSPEQGTSVDVIENRSSSTPFTDHNSPLLHRTSGNPTLYTKREGMYFILA